MVIVMHCMVSNIVIYRTYLSLKKSFERYNFAFNNGIFDTFQYIIRLQQFNVAVYPVYYNYPLLEGFCLHRLQAGIVSMLGALSLSSIQSHSATLLLCIIII